MQDLVQVQGAKTPTFYFRESNYFTTILKAHIDFIADYALTSGRSARICLHKDTQSDLHNMVIAHIKGSYIRPHKHPSKSKAYQILSGEMRILGINDSQYKIFDITLGKEKILRIEPNIYLLLLPLSDVVVFHEIALGPFCLEGENAQIYAPFSPSGGNWAEIKEFIESYM